MATVRILMSVPFDITRPIASVLYPHTLRALLHAVATKSAGVLQHPESS